MITILAKLAMKHLNTLCEGVYFPLMLSLVDLANISPNWLILQFVAYSRPGLGVVCEGYSCFRSGVLLEKVHRYVVQRVKAAAKHSSGAQIKSALCSAVWQW